MLSEAAETRWGRIASTIMGQERHLHGIYHCKAYKVVNITKSYQWQKKAGLKLGSTEALVTAAQEQAQITRLIEAGICYTRQDPR